VKDANVNFDGRAEKYCINMFDDYIVEPTFENVIQLKITQRAGLNVFAIYDINLDANTTALGNCEEVNNQHGGTQPYDIICKFPVTGVGQTVIFKAHETIDTESKHTTETGVPYQRHYTFQDWRQNVPDTNNDNQITFDEIAEGDIITTGANGNELTITINDDTDIYVNYV
jgi:hypothetical protein